MRLAVRPTSPHPYAPFSSALVCVEAHKRQERKTMNSKKITAPAADTHAEKPESSLDGLVIKAPKTFRGLFRAWARQVPDLDDPAKKVSRFKCVCQVPTRDPDVKVDVAAWISEAAAKNAGIVPGAAFVGTFAYDGVRLGAERGQYNEERSLTNATLIAVG